MPINVFVVYWRLAQVTRNLGATDLQSLLTNVLSGGDLQ
jgi:hypothetical protein